MSMYVGNEKFEERGNRLLCSLFHAQGPQARVLRIMVYLQTLKFSPAHLLELALEVFSLTYPDMLSLTPYKCKHQTEKKKSYKNNMLW